MANDIIVKYDPEKITVTKNICPLMKFYKLMIKKAKLGCDIKDLDVSSFKVTEKDYKVLEKLVYKFAKLRYPYFKKEYLMTRCVPWHMLQYAPSVDYTKTILEGTCLIKNGGIRNGDNIGGE